MLFKNNNSDVFFVKKNLSQIIDNHYRFPRASPGDKAAESMERRAEDEPREA
jgi:hypothetical protein